MRHSETRKVKPDFEYTADHLLEIGRYWAQQAPNRLFLDRCDDDYMLRLIESGNYSATLTGNFDEHYKTGLTEEALQGAPVPLDIILPTYTGGHWVSFAISITKENEQTKIKVSYSDSLSSAGPHFPRSGRTGTEANRILSILRAVYKDVPIETEFYKYRWCQSDITSCGPYCIENAIRCLAGKEQEPNPGRTAIRTKQLDQMVTATLIKTCSTNNDIEPLLLYRLEQCFAQNRDYKFRTSAELENFCVDYANEHHLRLEDIRSVLYQENNQPASDTELRIAGVNATLEHWYDTYRIDFLNKKEEIDSKKFLHAIENMRLKIAKKYGEEKSYKIMGNFIIPSMTGKFVKKRNQSFPPLYAIYKAELKAKLRTNFDTPPPGMASLGYAYRNIFQASKAIRSLSHPIKLPREVLEEQIKLLKIAIVREDANLVESIAFLINDFIGWVGHFATFGKWQPEYQKINALKKSMEKTCFPLQKKDLYEEKSHITRLMKNQDRVDEAVYTFSYSSFFSPPPNLEKEDDPFPTFGEFSWQDLLKMPWE